jgi:hypothetical protein
LVEEKLKVFTPEIKYTTPTTNTSGYVILSRFYYEEPYAKSDGRIYLVNQNPKTDEKGNKGESYFYDYGGRLEIENKVPDEKIEVKNRKLEACDSINPSISLSAQANNNVTRGEWHTARATYWLNVRGGGNADPACQINLTHRFYRPHVDE